MYDPTRQTVDFSFPLFGHLCSDIDLQVSLTSQHRCGSLSKSEHSLSFPPLLRQQMRQAATKPTGHFKQATLLEVPGLKMPTEASSVGLLCHLSCVTAACLPRVPSGAKTLSHGEIEVISRHTAQLCEPCKHPPPSQPKDKNREETVLGGEMRKGYWDPKGHTVKISKASSSSSGNVLWWLRGWDCLSIETKKNSPLIHFYKLLSWGLQSFKVKNIIVWFNSHNAITECMNVIVFVWQQRAAKAFSPNSNWWVLWEWCHR